MSDPELEAFYNRLADRAMQRADDARRVVRGLPLQPWLKAAVMRYLQHGQTSSRFETDAWMRVVEGSVDLQNSKTKGG